jgi:pathogenesis-related protein 1
MIRILFFVCGSLLLLLSLTIVQPAKISSNKPTIDTTVFIAQHNFYRAKVGSPTIHWNDSLAAYAQAWADKLAQTCDMQHSDGPYGENIYWSSAPKNEKAVVDRWASEEKYFNHNNPIYIRGKSSKSGHYSQVIWAKSTELGAGVANCKNGGQIWVCVYNPPGNMIGEKAY